MERRDFIKDQIEDFGRVLGKLLMKLVGAKGPGDVEQSTHVVEQALSSELDLDLAELLEKDNDDFIQTLVHDLDISDDNLGRLAELIWEIGKNKLADISKKHFEKSLAIYQYLSNHSQTYSLVWINKIKKLQSLIDS
ncbi:MAG: hypothetical protein JXQ96_22025 [Cyclobacteriaceae bacterium]